MSPPRSERGFVRMPDAEFEPILTRAAEEGAKRALADAMNTRVAGLGRGKKAIVGEVLDSPCRVYAREMHLLDLTIGYRTTIATR